MQAKDLIVLGSSRLLGKLYCGDIDIGGSASISTISSALSLTNTTDSSSTTTGALKVSGGVGIAKKLYVGGNTYHSGSTYFGSTYNISSSGQATLSQVKVGTGSGDTTITNNSATIANINSSTITNSGNISNKNGIIETDEIQSNVWNIVSTQNLGGDFFVAPTIMVTEGSTFYINSISNGVIAGYIVDSTNITSDSFAGHSWTSGSKIKLTGKITKDSNSYILGTCDGTLTANMNSSSGRITFSVTCKSATLPTATGSYTISDGTVMMYSVGGTNKVGIYMTSYGIDHSDYNANNANKRNKYSYIDIFNGSDGSNPKVRIGKLNGLPAINSISPEGYGIYTTNGYFEGKVVANGGKIGGWTIGDGYITSNSNRTTYNATTAGITIDKDGIGAGNGSLNTFYLKHSDGSMMVKKGSIAGWRIETTYLASGTATAPAADTILLSPSGTTSPYNVGGKNQSGWVLTAGTTFGVDKTGGLYATSAHITGEITATALKIGSTDYLNDIQDISNKASSTSLTTEINQRKAKYGTQSATSTDATSQVKAITCSNFELVAGNEITVYFKYANTYASGAVQLNVNSKGAKNIWVANAVTSTTNKLLWGKDAYITFRYNGSAFIVIGEPRIWYGACSTSASANAKTDTTAVTGCVICKGTVVNLAMTNENTGTAPTLNIQSTGALALYAGTGTTRPLASNGLSWSANTSQDFVFDGVQWRTSDSGSAARSKALSDAAAKTATNCITEISNAGIWVTPFGKKPDVNGDAIVDSTTGTLINADGVGIYKAGTKVAQYGNTITLGQETSGSFRTKVDSDTFWITNGTIDIAYIGNGNEITDTFVSDGTTMEYELSSTYSSGGVFSPSTVSGTKKSGENKIVISSGLPEEGTIFTYTYMPSDPVTYYTMGYRTNDSAVGIYSFVEGHSNIASGKYSHAEGWINTASGSASHAEGSGNTASGKYSHAEGGGAVRASGDYSHAEGNHTVAKGKYSHAEGTSTEANGMASHAEGYLTEASNDYAHSEGSYTHAFAEASHAEGYNTTAMQKYSHAQNQSTIANKKAQTVIGSCNIIDDSSTTMHTSGDTTYGNYAFIVGNGYVDSNSTIHRSNALTVDWNGTITANGYICNNIGGNSSTTHASILSTWFANHKSSISRNTVLSYWSSAYGNGSQYMGYFLNGYDTSPYGGFFVCHYTTPWYVGISNGSYTQYELTRTATSSRKTKENIKLMKDDEAKKLYDLDVISFDYKKEYEEGKKNQFGLIAEDCDEIIPYVVNKPDNNKDSIWGIDYVKFVPYLIKNLQLHEEKIKELEKEIEILKSQKK